MNGATPQYHDMYQATVQPIKDNLLFRPMVKGSPNILFSGQLYMQEGKPTLEPMVQHLGCFAGGMIALGARITQSDDDIQVARKLTEGCIWAYNNTQSGLMPEVFHVTPCTDPCKWDESRWHSEVKHNLEDQKDNTLSDEDRVLSKIRGDRLIEGYTKISSRKFLLR